MNPRATKSYYASWAIIFLLALVAVFGGWIKPHGIGEKDKINFVQTTVDGELKYEKPPFPPGRTFWFGSDHRGFDMASLLLNGFKYTMGTALAITLLRFLLALPWGMWSGVTGRSANALRTMQWIVSAVPAFLFLFPPLFGMYFGLGLNTGTKANPHYLMMFTALFYVMATFLGVFPLAYQIAQRAKYYNEKPYVEASRLMGGGLLHTMRRHLLPGMRLELLFIFLSEFVQVLFLLGQLAVFHISVGGSETLEWDLFSGYYIHITTTGEWTSLIAYGSAYVRLYPWIIVSAGTCFTAVIVALQFWIAQLKKRFGGTAAIR
jgi:peptide/nickel transport system permease protein